MTRKSFGLMTRKLSVTNHKGPPNSRNLFTQKTERRIGELRHKLRSTCCE